MKYAIIENGEVVDMAVADAPLSDNWVAATEAGIGWTYDGSAFIPPPGPTVEEQRAVMRTTRAKFALASFAAGLITDAEAEAWAGGTSLPQIVTDAFAANITDTKQRLAARIEALTKANIHRTNPLIVMLQAALGLTDDQVDALFT